MSAEHYLHHDADTRALIAEAEARGAVRALREAAEEIEGRSELATDFHGNRIAVVGTRFLRDRADRIEVAR